MRFLGLPMLAALVGCAAPDDNRQSVIAEYGASVQRDSLAAELHLFSWADYLDPEITAEFERVYGVRVVVDYYDTNEALIAKLKTGGRGQYDVLIASDYAVETLREADLLTPLRHDLLPNLRNLEDRFRAMPFDSGNAYTATYQWGTSGIGIRSDLVKTGGVELDTWRVVFDVQRQLGPFAMLADARETIGAALIYLGYSANTRDSLELASAEQLLMAQRPRVQSYSPFATGRDLLASGDVVVAHNYSGDILMARAEVPGIRYVIPREGAILWTDNMTIAAGAPAAYTAHVFINFMLDAAIGARLSNFTRYATPNRAAFPLIDPALRADPSVYPDSAVLNRLQVLRDIGPAREMYDRAWTRIRAAR